MMYPLQGVELRVVQKRGIKDKEHSNKNSNKNDSSHDGKIRIELAHILPNGEICFANGKLKRLLPANPKHALNFLEVLNSFIGFMNQKYHDSPFLFSSVTPVPNNIRFQVGWYFENTPGKK